MSKKEQLPFNLTPELVEAFEKLSKDERWWMERSGFLESHGYRLRPRFRPGWVPSWQNTGQDPINYEDARFHLVCFSYNQFRPN